jgi:GT2 family glycosyltransferase
LQTCQVQSVTPAITSPTVSVIVCCFTFDRLDDLRAAVNSVLSQTVTPDQIIVSVDNNPPLADALARTFPLSVLVIANDRVRGLSETRNVAIEVANGDILAFLDDDAVAEPDWLENILQAFETPDVMAVGGESVPVWERGAPPRWFPPEYDFIVGCTAHKRLIVRSDGEVRSVTGSNMAFRREVFSKLGGWKKELGRGQTKTGGEEAELCLRLKHDIPGARILHEARAVVRHKVGRERSTFKYVFSYAFNEGIVRAQLRRYTLRFMGQPLAAERLFVRRLMFSVIPGHVTKIYRPEILAQSVVIFINTVLVALGYARGRVMYRLPRGK